MKDTIGSLKAEILYWYGVQLECQKGLCEYFDNRVDYIKNIIATRKHQLAELERATL